MAPSAVQHPSGVSPMRVALFNDTGRTSHVGCRGVSRGHRQMLARSGSEIVFRSFLGEWRELWAGERAESLKRFHASSLPRALANVDAVVVNGEGTIHHGAGLHLLTILAGAQELGLPTYLVNSVFQECEDDLATLRGLTDFTVRDARSAAYLARLKVPHRIVLDSIFEADFSPAVRHDFSGKIVLTDWHPARRDVGAMLEKLQQELGAAVAFYPLEHPDRVHDWRHAVADLRTAHLVVTARHHGVCLTAFAGVPFVALGSNTWKIEGMLELLPGRLKVCSNFRSLRHACQQALSSPKLFKEVSAWVSSQRPLTTFQHLAQNRVDHASLGRTGCVPATAPTIALTPMTQLSTSSDSSKLLLLPTGIAQLASMVAALRQQGLSVADAKVLSIISCFNSAMESAMEAACASWGMQYEGNYHRPIADVEMDPTKLAPNELAKWRENPSDFVSRFLERSFPELSRFRGRIVILPARPNMVADFYYVSALQPSRIILVADGIQNEVIIRSFVGPRWAGFNSDLAQFPTAADIWCPNFLARDTAGIGRAKIIDSAILDAVFAELAASSLGQHLKSDILSKRKLPKSIVLSQHFALSRLCGEDDEVEYYAAIVRELSQAGQLPILFKRHPRDPAAKAKRLRDLGVLNPDDIIFTDDLSACVPIECLAHLWDDVAVAIYGSSSSALLGMRAAKNSHCVCADSEGLPPDLRKQIVLFATKNDLPRKLLKMSVSKQNSSSPAAATLCGAQIQEALAQTSLRPNKRNRNASGAEEPARPTVLFVSHEASRSGAPICLLNVLKWLRANTDLPFSVLLGRGGPLEPDFRAVADTYIPDDIRAKPSLLDDVALIYSNTCTNGLLLESLPCSHIPVVTHAHELDYIIESFGAANFAAVKRHTAHWVACSQAVATSLTELQHVASHDISIHFEAVPVSDIVTAAGKEDVAKARARFGVPANALLVVGCGRAEWRKGPDLFVQLAATMCREWTSPQPLHFIWAGFVPDDERGQILRRDVRASGLEGCVKFTGPIDNPHPLLNACDVFVLPSREDPFPLVMLEAAVLGKTMVCFERSGGAEEFSSLAGSLTAPYLDVSAMARRCRELLEDPALRRSLGEKAAHVVREHFDTAVLARQLHDSINHFLTHPPLSAATREKQAQETFARCEPLLRNGQLDAARAMIHKANGVFRDRTEIAIPLARLESHAGNFTEAVALLQQAAKLDPHNAAPLVELATVQLRAGDITSAEASLRKALELEPQQVTAVNLLGHLLRSQKRFSEAAKQFASLVKLTRGDADALVAQAYCSAALGQKVLAEILVDRALLAAPDHSSANTLRRYFASPATIDLSFFLAAPVIPADAQDDNPRRLGDILADQFTERLAAHRNSTTTDFAPATVEGAAQNESSPLTLYPVANRHGFEQLWKDTLAPLIDQQQAVAPLHDDAPFQLPGFCVVCGKPSVFQTDFLFCAPRSGPRRIPSWRERQVCECGMNCRMRSCFHVLTALDLDRPDASLYCTEQTTPLFAKIKRRFQNVTGSEFFGDKIPLGAVDSNGIRNEDITQLTFADQSFDAIFSIDVLEHVPSYRKALSEMCRCLKPNGTLLLTAPFHFNKDSTIVRATLDAQGGVTHHLPPIYHGDPINSNGCLCFNDFGWDLLDDIRRAGFAEVSVNFLSDQRYGYIGLQYVILATRGADPLARR